MESIMDVIVKEKVTDTAAVPVTLCPAAKKSVGKFIASSFCHNGISGNFRAGNSAVKRTLGATIALLQKAARIIANAEEKIAAQEEKIAHLEDLSTTDDLTGLKNRRGFLESFTSEINRCNRDYSKGGLLLMIDLDNFKNINDIHGHLAGDSCLRLVAKTLNSAVRPMDSVARIGGDEFVVLLSNATKLEAAGRAQTLACQLNNLSLAWYGEEISVQASLGLRSFGAGENADKIFNDADMALYSNKSSKKGTSQAAQQVSISKKDKVSVK